MAGGTTWPQTTNQSQSNSTTPEYSDAELVLLGAATAVLVLAIVFGEWRRPALFPTHTWIGSQFSLSVLCAGNVMVITAILRFQRLRTITNLFIASLAVADLIMGVFVVPFSSSHILLQKWMFGSNMCLFWTATDVLCVTASIETLCVIALDRYLAIMKPLRYPTLLTRARAFAAIFAVWFVACLISFVPIYLDVWKDKKEPTNTSDSCEFNINKYYAVTSSIVSFYLPLVVMIFLYSRVFLEAQKQLEKIRGRERHVYNLHNSGQLTYPHDSPALRPKSDGVDKQSMQQREALDMVNGEKGGSEKGEGKQSATKRLKFCLKEHKAVKTLGIIMGTFTLCWLPFFILNILVTFNIFGQKKVLFRVLNWLGYSNSAFNPLIYCRSPDFRHAFQEILHLRDKGGSWRRCSLRRRCSKAPRRQNGSSDAGGVSRLDTQTTSDWRGTLESSTWDGSPTLSLPASSSEQFFGPGWQADRPDNACKDRLASIT